MTNTEFWKSISIIINSGFDKDGIIKLEEYAEQFFNKQLLFKRYTPSEQHGCATGGSFHVVASLLAGAETPADQLTAPQGSFKRECQRAEAQADYLSDMHDENLIKSPQGNISTCTVENAHFMKYLPLFYVF